MQSNLYPEDTLFGFWNELDGGPPPPSFGLPNMPPVPPPHHPMLGGPPPPPFDNGAFGFVPPPIALSCPVEPPPMCAPCPGPPSVGPIHRNFPRYPPATLAPLQAMIPGPGHQPPPPLMGQVTHHFGPFQQPKQLPPPIAMDHGLERTQLNDIGQMEQVVVKNGQVFHISFLDEPSEPDLTPGLPTPISEDGDGDEGQSRDWINYDELPLLKNMASGESEVSSEKNGYEQSLKSERFDCKLCGTRYNRSSKLEHHIQQHHPEVLAADEAGTPLSPSGTPVLNDFSNYCVECEEFFRSAGDLQNHMEQNHRLIDDSKSPKEAKKNIGCPFCLETFEWPCMLKTHMTKHTGEKPFICDRCNVSFRFVQSFYRHNRRVHGREK